MSQLIFQNYFKFLDSLDDGPGLAEVKTEKKTAPKQYRFAFKKTLMKVNGFKTKLLFNITFKENGIKDESAPKSISRRILEKKERERLTPSRELLAQRCVQLQEICCF